MEGGTTGPIHFLNLEYFFRLLYESRVGVVGEGGATGMWSALFDWMVHTWSVLGLVAFVFSLFAFAILAYATVRMYQIKEIDEHLNWTDLDPVEAEHNKDRSRWAHVQELIESPHERDWKEAISEADVMLADVLADRGYEGDTTTDRLAKADPSHFATRQEAIEAHALRNEIAQGGEEYRLDDNIAYRTIKKYEAVFKEFGEI